MSVSFQPPFREATKSRHNALLALLSRHICGLSNFWLIDFSLGQLPGSPMLGEECHHLEEFSVIGFH